MTPRDPAAPVSHRPTTAHAPRTYRRSGTSRATAAIGDLQPTTNRQKPSKTQPLTIARRAAAADRRGHFLASFGRNGRRGGPRGDRQVNPSPRSKKGAPLGASG